MVQETNYKNVSKVRQISGVQQTIADCGGLFSTINFFTCDIVFHTLLYFGIVSTRSAFSFFSTVK